MTKANDERLEDAIIMESMERMEASTETKDHPKINNENSTSSSHEEEEEDDDKRKCRKLLNQTMMVMNGFAATILIASLIGLLLVVTSDVDDGDTKWPRVTSNCLGIGLWGLYIGLSIFCLRRTARVSTTAGASNQRSLAYVRNSAWLYLFFSILTGTVLAVGSISSCGKGWVFFFFFYHVFGLMGAILSLATWFGLPGAIRTRMQRPTTTTRPAERAAASGASLPVEQSRHLRPIRKVAVCIVVLLTIFGPWCGMWLAYWGLVHASVDESMYPNQATSPYKLPLYSGVTVFLVQGNQGRFSHYDEYNQYSWDFMASCGTSVVAAHSGIVTTVVDTYSGNHFSGQTYNNYISIAHNGLNNDEQNDGKDTLFTLAEYLHIQKGSAKVQPGDFVQQGEPIARVGNVGMSSGPHLHFSVSQEVSSSYRYQPIPVSFRDVTKHNGIPRPIRFYTSGNDREAAGDGDTL